MIMRIVNSAIALIIMVMFSWPALAANDGGVCSSADITSGAAACDDLFTGNSYALMLAGLGAVGFIASRRRQG
jgi:hypothetical protein